MEGIVSRRSRFAVTNAYSPARWAFCYDRSMSWNRGSSASAPPLPTPVPGTVAASARILGRLRLGASALVAQGTVVRSLDESVALGNHSVVLENSVVIGSPDLPVRIGRRTVFGHRCQVIGATLGDLCEIGNGSILLPGARLGDHCFLGEGTLVPDGMVVPSDTVLVGRPARMLRRVNQADLDRLARLREGNLELTDEPATVSAGAHDAGADMGTLYAYKDKQPRVAPSALLFDSAEVTGDVTIGEGTIIGAGVKIIGDSHGPVRIGNRVQILENAVLHLLPDNELILEDDVVIGPGGMIHGCHIGAGSIVEPAAIVCDWAVLGRNCRVTAGSVVVQRTHIGDDTLVQGFPAQAAGHIDGPQERPSWALRREDLASLVRLR
jgi:carbonic anhydrase/acetyltransferase-like protein (isoleucine patch superfamily)